ncbi:MAG: Fpg/Nei family DNA glycosylase [Acidimicrobiia bacterium]|nr:Fpg/Nei family DNA glycosylase [Acidimicrobiia bacterium]
MPEGDTIHRHARNHRDLFVGRNVAASSPQGRFSAGASHINGKRLEAVEAVGKHLFYTFEKRLMLHVHLGLVGSFRTHRTIERPAPSRGTRLVLSAGDAAAYLTGPMKCELLDRIEVHRLKEWLGPDPLDPEADVGEFASNLATRTGPIGAVLLDQDVIAGIGNVWRAELLFLCHIDPDTPANELTSGQVDCLWTHAVTGLQHGVEVGQIETVTPQAIGLPKGTQLRPSDKRYVYKRGGHGCLLCGAEIAVSRHGGRALFYCPQCQDPLKAQ